MKFVAYFDYLGFADFIRNNDLAYQQRILGHIFRDIENALANGRITQGRQHMIADLSDLRVNCINFSDTVICWTNDDSIESLKEILKVVDIYNWQCIDFFFPIRGALAYGEIEKIKYDYDNTPNNVSYGVNSVFGKGLLKAYEKAESLDWAGTVIDESLISFLQENNINVDETLTPHAKKYRIPYKNLLDRGEDEWAFNLITNGPLNDEAYKNMKKNIVDNFAKHNKRVDSEGVQRKIRNTVAFLESYR
jgi:hypothetical protein